MVIFIILFAITNHVLVHRYHCYKLHIQKLSMTYVPWHSIFHYDGFVTIQSLDN